MFLKFYHSVGIIIVDNDIINAINAAKGYDLSQSQCFTKVFASFFGGNPLIVYFHIGIPFILRRLTVTVDIFGKGLSA